MNLLLIDKRISHYEIIVAAVDSARSACLTFDYNNDTIDTIKTQISGVVVANAAFNGCINSIGIIQHSYSTPTFSIVDSERSELACIIEEVETLDPGLTTWSTFTDLIAWLKTEYGIAHFDMMACAIYSNPNWKYIIDTSSTHTGVEIRASTDNTGSSSLGGNWFLESHNGVNLKHVYFTDAIDEFNGLLSIANHSMYATSLGKVYSTGNNGNGQLGLGNATSINTPTLITSGIGSLTITSIAIGSDHSLFVSSSGTVYATGINVNGQLGFGNNTITYSPLIITPSIGSLTIVSVSCGSSHSVFITSSGAVYTTGSNNNGQLGLGNTTNVNSPTLVTSNIGGLIISSASCGASHTIFLASSGAVYGAGRNSTGQLGLNDTTQRTSPTLVTSTIGSLAISRVSSGHDFTLFLTNTGAVYGTGYNLSGQLGLANNTDTNVPTLITTTIGSLPVVRISCGADHAVFLTSSGKVYSTGANSSGQLGLGNYTNVNVPTLVTSVIGSLNIIAISCGRDHTMFLTDGGTVYATGANGDGRLGVGDNTNKNVPTSVSGTYNMLAESVSFVLTSPTIGPLNTIPTKTFGTDVSFNITAPSSNSTGAFTFSSSNTAVATISSTTVTIVGAGTSTITATQASNAEYSSSSVSTTLTVNTALPTFGTFTLGPKSGSYQLVDASFSLTAPSSNSSGAFTYVSDNSGVATINTSNPSVPYVNLVANGTANITATQDACGNYSSKSVSSLLTVSDIVPTLGSFVVSSFKAYGDASFAIITRPTSNSSGAITYSSSNTAVATIDASGNWITLVGAGNVSFNATQAAVVGQYTSATTTSNILDVSLGIPTLSSSTFSVASTKAYGDASFAITTRPTSNSSGAITYTSSNTSVATIDASGNWINIIAPGDVSFNATQEAVPNRFTGATKTSNTLTVSKATPSLTFATSTATKNVTDAAFTVTASSASSGSVTYTSSNTSLATVDSSTGQVTLKGAGTVTITAAQASTAFYNAPTNAACSIVINAAGSALAGQTVSPTTSFSEVDLSGASFSGSTLSGVSFSGANLSNVNFSGAVITGTNFTNANISGATNLPTFSTTQKLQLLSNINNVAIGAIQIVTPLTGTDINALLSSPVTELESATFTLKVPTTLDASLNKIVSVTIDDVSNNTSVYIPMNANESVKINGVAFTFDGTNVRDASNNIRTYLTILGIPFKVYAGSIIGLNILSALNSITVTSERKGLYDIISELFTLKT